MSIYIGVAVPLSAGSGVLMSGAANEIARRLTDLVDVTVQGCQISNNLLRMFLQYNNVSDQDLLTAITASINAVSGLAITGQVSMYSTTAPTAIVPQSTSSGGGSSSSVSSVFGRVGNVMPQVGDYSFAHLSGSLDGGIF